MDDNSIYLDLILDTSKAMQEYSNFTNELERDNGPYTTLYSGLSDDMKAGIASLQSVVAPLQQMLTNYTKQFSQMPLEFSASMASTMQSLRSTLENVRSSVVRSFGFDMTKELQSTIQQSIGLASSNISDITSAVKSMQAISTALGQSTSTVARNIADLGSMANNIIKMNPGAISDIGAQKILMGNNMFVRSLASVGVQTNNKQLVDAVLNLVTSTYLDKTVRSDYINRAAAASRGGISTTAVREYATLAERLPKAFRGMKFNLDKTPSDERIVNDTNVGKLIMAAVRKEAATNDILRQGIIHAGLGYMENGDLVSKKQWTRSELNEVYGYVHHALGTALAGNVRYRKDPDSTDEEIQRKLANNSSQRTTKAFNAMKVVGDVSWLKPYYAQQRTAPTLSDEAAQRTKVSLNGVSLDQYQVPAYAISELKAGRVIPLDRKEYDEHGKKRTDFQHGFIDLTESVLTRLMKMSGHNTYGRNVMGDNGEAPPIIAISDSDLFEKVNGQIQYQPGTMRRVVNRGNLAYMSNLLKNGLHQYGADYEILEQTSSGEFLFGRKDLKQAAIDEARAHGWGNPFTSFSDDNFYESRDKAMKAIDYNAKIASPGARLSDAYGYAIPRTALVNMAAYYDAMGTPNNERHDGMNFVMPDFLPQSMQMRRPGIKGTDMRLDYREYLRQAGMVDAEGHVYMPGINATKEDVIAFREGRYGPKDADFLEKFVDVMDPKYNALTFDSTFKIGSRFKHADGTPMSQREVEDQLYEMNKYYDTSVMRTAGDWDIDKNWISAQVVKSLRLDDDYHTLRRMQENEFLRKFNTVDGLVDLVFNDDSELSKQIREGNYNMLWSGEARSKIEATRKAIQQKIEQGAMYVPDGYKLAMIANSPGNIFAPYAKDVLKAQLTNFGENTVLGSDEMAYLGLSGALQLTSRFPSNPGEQEIKRNIFETSAKKRDAFQLMIDQMGLDPDAAFLSRAGVYNMGTADFDGDFIAIMNGAIVAAAQKSNDIWGNFAASEKKRIEEEAKKNTEENVKKVQTEVNGDLMLQNTEERGNATAILGAVDSGQRALDNINMANASEVERGARASAYLAEAYDEASSSKTRNHAVIAKVASDFTNQLGLPLDKILNHVTKDMENSDFNASAYAIQNKMLPGIFDRDSIGKQIAMHRARLEGTANVNDINAWFEEITAANHGNDDTAEGAYVRKWFDVARQITTGEAGYVSKEDLGELEYLMSEYARKAAMGGNEGTIARMERLNRALRHTKERGVTEWNLGAKNGYGQMLIDAGMHGTSSKEVQRAIQDYQYEQLQARIERDRAEGTDLARKRLESNGTHYSISDLNLMASSPKDFIGKLYGQGKEINWGEKELGDIYHRALEQYANARLEGVDHEKALEDAMEAVTRRIADTEMDESLEENGISHKEYFQRLRNSGKLDAATKRTREVLEWMRNKRIASSEEKFALDWQGINPDAQSYGSSDIRFIDENGVMWLMDLKASLNQFSHTPQPAAYGNFLDRAPTDAFKMFGNTRASLGGIGLGANGESQLHKIGFISLNLNDLNRGTSFSVETIDYNKELGERARGYYTEMGQLANEVVASEQQGIPYDVKKLTESVNRIREKYKDLLAQMGAEVDLVSDQMEAATPPASQGQNPNQTSTNPPNNPPTPPNNPPSPPNNPPNNPPTPPNNQPTPPILPTPPNPEMVIAIERMKASIASYQEFMSGLSNTMYKEAHKGETSNSGRFAYYRHQVSELEKQYESIMDQSEKVPIDNDLKTDLSISLTQLRKDFRTALMHAAEQDMDDANEAIMGIIDKSTKTSRQNEYDQVQDIYRKSSQQLNELILAHQELADKVHKREQQGQDTTADKYVLSAMQAKIDASKQKQHELMENVQYYIDDYYVAGMDDDYNRLAAMQIGGTPAEFSKINSAVSKMGIAKQRLLADLDKVSGDIDPKDFEARQKKYSALDPEAYRTYLLSQYDKSVDDEISAMAELRDTGTNIFGRGRYGNLLKGYNSRADKLSKANEAMRAKISSRSNVSENDKGYESAQTAIKKYTSAIHDNESAIKSLTGSNAKIKASLVSLGETAVRVGERLMRQAFQRMAREAIQFVQQFNESMTEIQTITMKSDSDMRDVRERVVNQAIEMKASVEDVSSMYASLYRQGLSDSDVETRSEDILKFARVTGVKTEAAVKIITTALQNDLVGSAEEAMDSLVALGDSAATTADEIAKAMQKCAASAKVAGVSYGELNSMITVMTSMTQLSGTQVGTALNTLFSRMRNVTTKGYTEDINGESTSLNKVEEALQLAGIDMREKSSGDFRSTTDILVDVASKWNSMSDIQKANLSTTMASTRAANMFNTLMEGMSADNGETFRKYLDLANNSEGITDTKYEISIKSLSSALAELKSSFDGVIESVSNDGVIVGFVNVLTNITSGVRAVTENLTALPMIIAGVTGAIIALNVAAATSMANPVIMALVGAVGAVALVGGIGSLVKGAVNSGKPKEQTAEEVQRTANTYQQQQFDKQKKITDQIEKVRTLGTQYDEYKNSGKDATRITGELQKAMADLSNMMPGFNKSFKDSVQDIDSWATVVQNAADAAKDFKESGNYFTELKQNEAAEKTLTEMVDKEAESKDTYSADQNIFKVLDDWVEENDAQANRAYETLHDGKNPYPWLSFIGRNSKSSDESSPEWIGNYTETIGQIMLALFKEDNPDFDPSIYTLNKTGKPVSSGADLFQAYLESLDAMAGTSGYAYNGLATQHRNNMIADMILSGGTSTYYQQDVEKLKQDRLNILFGMIDEFYGTILNGLTGDDKDVMIGAIKTDIERGFENGIENARVDEMMDVLKTVREKYRGPDAVNKARGNISDEYMKVFTKDGEQGFISEKEALEQNPRLTKYDLYKADGSPLYLTPGQRIANVLASYRNQNKSYDDQIGLLRKIFNNNPNANKETIEELLKQANNGEGILDLETIMNSDDTLLALYNAWSNGSKIITSADIGRQFSNMLSGRSGYSQETASKALKYILGENWQSRDNINKDQWGVVSNRYNQLDPAEQQILQIAPYWTQLNDIFTNLDNGIEPTAEAFQALKKAVDKDALAALVNLNKYGEAVVDTFLNLRGSIDEVVTGMASMYSSMDKTSSALRIVSENKGREGAKLSNDAVSLISSTFGISDESEIRSAASEVVNVWLEAIEESAQNENNNYVGATLAQSIAATLMGKNFTQGEFTAENLLAHRAEYGLTDAQALLLKDNANNGMNFVLTLNDQVPNGYTYQQDFDPNSTDYYSASNIYQRNATAVTQQRKERASQLTTLNWLQSIANSSKDINEFESNVDKAIKAGDFTGEDYDAVMKIQALQEHIASMKDDAGKAIGSLSDVIDEARTDLLGITYMGSSASETLSAFLGEDIMRQIAAGTAFKSETTDQTRIQGIMADPANAEKISFLSSKYEGFLNIISKVAQGVEVTESDIRTLTTSMVTDAVVGTDTYNKKLQELAATIASLQGDPEEVADVLTKMYSTAAQLNDQLSLEKRIENKSGLELRKTDHAAYEMAKSISGASDSEMLSWDADQLARRMKPFINATKMRNQRNGVDVAGTLFAMTMDANRGTNSWFGPGETELDTKTMLALLRTIKTKDSQTAQDTLQALSDEGLNVNVTIEVDEKGNITMKSAEATGNGNLTSDIKGNTTQETLSKINALANDDAANDLDAAWQQLYDNAIHTAGIVSKLPNTDEMADIMQQDVVRTMLNGIQGNGVEGYRYGMEDIQQVALNGRYGTSIVTQGNRMKMMNLLFGTNWKTDLQSGRAEIQSVLNTILEVNKDAYLSGNMQGVFQKAGIDFNDFVSALKTGGNVAKEMLRELGDAMSIDFEDSSDAFVSYMQKAQQALEGLTGSAGDALTAIANLYKSMNSTNDTMFIANRAKQANKAGMDLTQQERQLLYAHNLTDAQINGMTAQQLAPLWDLELTDAASEQNTMLEQLIKSYITEIGKTLLDNFKFDKDDALTITPQDLLQHLPQDQVIATLLGSYVADGLGGTMTFAKGTDDSVGLSQYAFEFAPETTSDSFISGTGYDTYLSLWNTDRQTMTQANALDQVNEALIAAISAGQTLEQAMNYLQANFSEENFEAYLNQLKDDGTLDYLHAYDESNGNQMLDSDAIVRILMGDKLSDTSFNYGEASDFLERLFNMPVDSVLNAQSLPQEVYGRVSELSQNQTEWDYIMKNAGQIGGLTDVLDALLKKEKDVSKGTAEMARSMASLNAQALDPTGKYTNQLADSLANLKTSTASAAKEYSKFVSGIAKESDKGVAGGKAQGKTWKQMDKLTRELVKEFTGEDEEFLRKQSADYFTRMGQAMIEEASDVLSNYYVPLALQMVNDVLGQAFDGMSQEDIELVLKNNMIVRPDGTIDLSALIKYVETVDANVAAFLRSISGIIGEANLVQQMGEDGFKISWDVNMLKKGLANSFGSGKRGYSGTRKASGGGGSKKKTATELLNEQLEEAKTMAEHKLKMLSYKESYYQTAGELTNYNRALAEENRLQQELIATLTEGLEKMKAHLATLDASSDEYKTVVKQILAYEEAIESANNTIAANNKKMRENEQEIRKLRTNLENQVVQEIKNRIQIQRDMVDGTVEMENIIIDAIRQRYQDEWDRQVLTD